MLKISPEAREIVRQIPTQPGQLPSAGLRIAAVPVDPERLRVSPTLKPRAGDHVVDFGGARVFLDAAAEERLDGRVLKVDTRPDGRLEFRSAPQDASSATDRARHSAA